MAKANTAVTDETEMSLPSFRDGISFNARKPDADGFIRIMDAVSGPQGQLMKLVAFEVLKRAFPNVTNDEVGKMEFEDLAPLLKVGMDGLAKLDSMGFQEISSS